MSDASSDSSIIPTSDSQDTNPGPVSSGGIPSAMHVQPFVAVPRQFDEPAGDNFTRLVIRVIWSCLPQPLDPQFVAGLTSTINQALGNDAEAVFRCTIAIATILIHSRR